MAGTIAAGANCAYTLDDRTEEMKIDAFVDFLEPNKDRAGALCMSASDYEKQKTALQKACHLLGNRCSPEFEEIMGRIDKLKQVSE